MSLLLFLVECYCQIKLPLFTSLCASRVIKISLYFYPYYDPYVCVSVCCVLGKKTAVQYLWWFWANDYIRYIECSWLCDFVRICHSAKTIERSYYVRAHTHTHTNNTWTIHNCTFSNKQVVNEHLRRSRLPSAHKVYSFKLYTCVCQK